MRKGDKRIFNDEGKLEELICLRSGDPYKWTYSALGRYFHCDHTTILYQLRQYETVKVFPLSKSPPKDEVAAEFPISLYFSKPLIPKKLSIPKISAKQYKEAMRPKDYPYCPDCGHRFVPTGESPDKCLYCFHHPKLSNS